MLEPHLVPAIPSVWDHSPVFAAITNEEDGPEVELQRKIQKSVSQQTELRHHELTGRFRAVLGQHAFVHCDQQLEGLRTHGLVDHIGEQHFPWPQTHVTEYKGFSQCSHAGFRDPGETLDSEATAGSSSDDEQLESTLPSENRAPCRATPYFERRWLEERAELGSRWSWLQLRVAELDGRIQQLTRLHETISCTKGDVVLRVSQQTTARQMKTASSRETAGLPCSAPDADNEPWSPARLLRNIERQSAHLSQIVNSLMPPLNLSPLSKPPKPRDIYVSRSNKRRRFGLKRGQLFKDDMSCICARTRPLVLYHKPRLFRLSSMHSKRSSQCSSSRLGFTSCLCSFCSSSSDPDSGFNGSLSSRTSSGDSSLFSCFTKYSAREEWSQVPLVINAPPLSPVNYRRQSSTPLYSSHKYKHSTQRHKKRILGLSPIEHCSSRQREHRVNQRKRKRRCENTEDEETFLFDSVDSLDVMYQENFEFVSQKQVTTKETGRRRNEESLFDIDNIIIPAALMKVETVQYSDILTPNWQELHVLPTSKGEEDLMKDLEEETEILTDEVFAKRHLPFEQKEKMRWCLWGKRHCRHSFRSGRRLSHSVGVSRSSGEDNSTEGSFKRLDTDVQLSSKECLPHAPWKRRVFPLTDDEESTLSSEVLFSDST